jgi:hypothetical protein
VYSSVFQINIFTNNLDEINNYLKIFNFIYDNENNIQLENINIAIQNVINNGIVSNIKTFIYNSYDETKYESNIIEKIYQGKNCFNDLKIYDFDNSKYFLYKLLLN